jgi:hypothetical protein
MKKMLPYMDEWNSASSFSTHGYHTFVLEHMEVVLIYVILLIFKVCRPLRLATQNIQHQDGGRVDAL